MNFPSQVKQHTFPLLAIALLSADAFAASGVCDNVSEQQGLFLGDTVDVQGSGEWQLETSAAGSVNGGERELEVEIEYGINERVQWQAGGGIERESGGETQRRVEASIGVGLRCAQDGPALRLDIGAVRDESDTAAVARLLAGGPFGRGSWHAGASHGTARFVRSYFGAAVVQTDFRPLAFEARRENDGNVWQTLFAAGIYLFTTDSMELAVGWSQLDVEQDPERREKPKHRLMLKLTGEF